MFRNLRARIKSWTINPRMWARIKGIAAGLLVCGANAVPVSAAGLGDAIATLAKLLIDGLIGLSAVLLAIGIVTGFVTGQIEVMVGRPGGLSSTWMRIAGIVICFVGAIFTVQIANTIIDTLAVYKGTEGIKLP
ncbi:MAG: hypothetical protein HY327_12745 [Chloroflexi bacterium]|nr:hypothetical protein [Chloroflexota bacterium]